MFTLYPWQRRAVAFLQGKDGLLSAPTGTGKTLVAYEWAGLTKDGKPVPVNGKGRIIFTAPIKALSNERYLSLKALGIPVGLETGDFKRNTDAPVICCTQEIYTQKYAHLHNQKVIIDEFHYIFTNHDRSRAYIDGLLKTPSTSKILLMSATFGEISLLKEYLERVAKRCLQVFETNERATELVFLKEPIELEQIKNALVFVFSAKGVEQIANEIASNRFYAQCYAVSPRKRQRIEELAKIFQISDVPQTVLAGVGMYYGAMLPKEKLFMETLYREKIIDVMVGTDALSLGVNLPAETVIFAQLAKYYDGPITKAEFLQMAGRAGRKGYFETGYVTFFPSYFEARGYLTAELYSSLLEKDLEPAHIKLTPDIRTILAKERSIEEEAKYVAEYSLPRRKIQEVKEEIEEIIDIINEEIHIQAEVFARSEIINREIEDEEKAIELYNRIYQKVAQRIADILKETYFNEFNVHTNVTIATLLATRRQIPVEEVIDVAMRDERNRLQAMLKTQKFLRQLPENFKNKISGKGKLVHLIHQEDHTVFGFEDVLTKVQKQKRQARKGIMPSF